MKTPCLPLLGAVILCTAQSPLYSQTRLGIMAGPSVPNFSGGTNELSQGYVSRLAPHVGITLEHDLSAGFSLRPAIMFDGQGGQRNGLQPVTSTSLPPVQPGGYYYADFRNTAVLNYVELPVLLAYHFGRRQIHVEVNAGPYFGFLVSATQKTSGTSLIYVDRNGTPLTFPLPPDYTHTVQAPPQSFDASTDVHNSIHRLNVGIEAGAGLFIPLWEAQSLSLEIHGLYGLTNIQAYAADGRNHTGNILISLGYAMETPWIW